MSHQLIMPLFSVFKYMVIKLIIQGIPFNSSNIYGGPTTCKILDMRQSISQSSDGSG